MTEQPEREFVVKQLQVDDSKEVDAFHINIGGRVVKKIQRCFTYRKGKGSDGSDVKVDLSGQVYLVGPGGCLLSQKVKLDKAGKKALKKAKTATRRAV